MFTGFSEGTSQCCKDCDHRRDAPAPGPPLAAYVPCWCGHAHEDHDTTPPFDCRACREAHQHVTTSGPPLRVPLGERQRRRAHEVWERGRWQPIETCPANVLEALLFYPALKLSVSGNLTRRLAGPGLIARSSRASADSAWQEMDAALEATGSYFDDDWEYGEPTHWMSMPIGPSLADVRRVLTGQLKAPARGSGVEAS